MYNDVCVSHNSNRPAAPLFSLCCCWCEPRTFLTPKSCRSVPVARPLVWCALGRKSLADCPAPRAADTHRQHAIIYLCVAKFSSVGEQSSHLKGSPQFISERDKCARWAWVIFRWVGGTVRRAVSAARQKHCHPTKMISADGGAKNFFCEGQGARESSINNHVDGENSILWLWHGHWPRSDCWQMKIYSNDVKIAVNFVS